MSAAKIHSIAIFAHVTGQLTCRRERAPDNGRASLRSFRAQKTVSDVHADDVVPRLGRLWQFFTRRKADTLGQRTHRNHSKLDPVDSQ